MITLTARIDLFSGMNGSLTSVTSNIDGNNISANIQGVLGEKKTVTNPFIIGVNKLGDGSTFSSGEEYFIGKQLADENGNFATPYEFVVTSSTSIDTLTIAFDDLHGRFPTHIIIDGVTYYDNDAIFTVSGLTSSTTHTIVISEWNTKGTPLIISGIYVDLSITIDRRNLLAIDTKAIDRSDLSLPSFGIISNGGSIEFNDTTGEVWDYANQGLLVSGLETKIYLNNTLSKTKQLVATLKTDKWEYDTENKSVRVTLKDGLEEWQEYPFNGFPFRTEKMNMLALYNYLPMTNNIILTSQARAQLANTYCPYPNMDSSSVWGAWRKICEVCGLQMFMREDGKVVVSTDMR